MKALGFIGVCVLALISGSAAKAQTRVAPCVTVDSQDCGPVMPGRPLPVRTDPVQNTYSAASHDVVPANAATDVFCVTGSATKTVKIDKIRISGTATQNAIMNISLLKRSRANSGGISTTPTIVAHDSTQPAATAVAWVYTANPTTGSLVGDLRTQKVSLSNTSGPNIQLVPVVFYFGTAQGKRLVLRGTDEWFCLNLDAQTISGWSLSIDTEWTEE